MQIVFNYTLACSIAYEKSRSLRFNSVQIGNNSALVKNNEYFDNGVSVKFRVVINVERSRSRSMNQDLIGVPFIKQANQLMQNAHR